MFEIRRTIEIEASPARVWQVLSAFASYPAWNPFIQRVDGEARRGSRISLVVKPTQGRALKLPSVVTVVEPERSLHWGGKLLGGLLFEADHGFEIEALGPTRVRFVHHEVFTGFFPLFLEGLFTRALAPSYDAMNTALKARAEAPDQSTPSTPSSAPPGSPA